MLGKTVIKVTTVSLHDLNSCLVVDAAIACTPVSVNLKFRLEAIACRTISTHLTFRLVLFEVIARPAVSQPSASQ